MGALLVALIPFPCADGTAGNAFHSLGGAAPQLLPRVSQAEASVVHKSCSAYRELWNEMGADNHSSETSPASVSLQCSYPLDPGLCAVCSP